MWDHTARANTEQEMYATDQRPTARRRAGKAAGGDGQGSQPHHALATRVSVAWARRQTPHAAPLSRTQDGTPLRGGGGTPNHRRAALTNSGWRVNFRGGAPVEVTLEGENRRGDAELVEDPEEEAGSLLRRSTPRLTNRDLFGRLALLPWLLSLIRASPTHHKPVRPDQHHQEQEQRQDELDGLYSDAPTPKQR